MRRLIDHVEQTCVKTIFESQTQQPQPNIGLPYNNIQETTCAEFTIELINYQVPIFSYQLWLSWNEKQIVEANKRLDHEP